MTLELCILISSLLANLIVVCEEIWDIEVMNRGGFDETIDEMVRRKFVVNN